MEKKLEKFTDDEITKKMAEDLTLLYKLVEKVKPGDNIYTPGKVDLRKPVKKKDSREEER